MKNKKILIILIIIIIILAFISIIFSLINIGNEEIYSNIKVQKISLAGKEKEEANSELNKIYNEKKIKRN